MNAARRSFTMMRTAMLCVVACAGLGLGHVANPDEVVIEFSETERRRLLQHSPLPDPPVDATNAFANDPRAARLGQFLFFDPRLSANGKLACATCHEPDRAFTDGKPIAEGLKRGQRNTPTLINSAYQRWYFWDGRSDTLWGQALHPIERDVELGSTRQDAINLIREDAQLKRAFEEIFGPLPKAHLDDRAASDRAFANVGKAIAAYEAKLISRRSPFDVFVEGLRENDAEKLAAISDKAKQGAKLFVGRGECRVCHTGPHFSDGEFHDILVPPRHSGVPSDPGRFEGVDLLRQDPFNAAGAFSDNPSDSRAQRLEFLANGPQNWGQFKTPSLRNVALTAPYMHQGQFRTLRDVLSFYSTMDGALVADHHDETIMRPRNFTDDEIEALIAFLESLTDVEIDPELLKAPPSPLLD